jgi:hypothetical protein
MTDREPLYPFTRRGCVIALLISIPFWIVIVFILWRLIWH